MGDHRIGQAMGNAADLWWHGRRTSPDPSQYEALDVLDVICKPYRNRDAEFEAVDPNNPTSIHPLYDFYTDPDGPLGRLIAIAFAAKPEELWIGDDTSSPWMEGPYTKFIKRYGFC